MRKKDPERSFFLCMLNKIAYFKCMDISDSEFRETVNHIIGEDKDITRSFGAYAINKVLAEQRERMEEYINDKLSHLASNTGAYGGEDESGDYIISG